MDQERPTGTTERFDASIAAVARRQHGLFRRDQMHERGATDGVVRARLRAGRWERVHPSVFRIAGHPVTWRQTLLAACFACGPGAVASHRAAAALWSLPGFPEGPVEVSSTGQRGRASATIRLHRARIEPSDSAHRDRIPVTTAMRTLLDLAAIVPTSLLEEALDDAIRRRLVRIERLRAHLEAARGRGRRGVRAIERLLDDRQQAGVPQSVFETKLLRLIRSGGLPEPVVQHPVRLGRANAIIDFAYPDLHLAIEADGYRWHSGRSEWEQDLARRNALTAAGWRVLHLTWTDMIRRPGVTLERITNAISVAAGAQPGTQDMGTTRRASVEAPVTSAPTRV